ncbi:MAG: YraN family protein [Firmicutes bacterium]|nr:YraN family protein [Bacillota bacterium]
MRKIGLRGEDIAVSHLKDNGYKILARNWRCERGELDIVAKDGEILVFVEVKTRRTDRHGTPAEAVDIRKQERLRLLALYYIHQTGTTAPAYRFDVVAVEAQTEKVTLYKNAFG